MSESTDSKNPEDFEEAMLLDDGFSIVDDINTGSTPLEAGDKKKQDEDEEEDNDLDSSSSQPKESAAEKPAKTKEDQPKPEKKPAEKPKITIKADKDLKSKQSNAKDKTNGTDDSAAEKSPVPKRKAGAEANFVWVSNVTKSVKASSLKKHFSVCGKVNTAKVVTNGKVFFGYVEFESTQSAADCIKKLNNSELAGRRVFVSRSRPDITRRAQPIAVKKPTRIETASKSSKENAAPSADAKKKETEKTEDKKKPDDKEKKKADDKDKPKPDATARKPSAKEEELRKKLDDARRKTETLRREVDRARIEINNLRRRLVNEEKKNKMTSIRCDNYKSEARELAVKMKDNREHYDTELRRLEKKHKAEMEKTLQQREMVHKHKEELKRRQDELDRQFRKLDEEKRLLERMKRPRKSRSVSPTPHKRYRADVYMEHRSPPPPPKLTPDARDKMPPSYYDDKKRSIYERLGDHPKEETRHHRNTYPVNSVGGPPKQTWSSQPPNSDQMWKKPSGSPGYLKPFMDRYAAGKYPSSVGFPPSGMEYTKRSSDGSRKY